MNKNKNKTKTSQKQNENKNKHTASIFSSLRALQTKNPTKTPNKAKTIKIAMMIPAKAPPLNSVTTVDSMFVYDCVCLVCFVLFCFVC